MSVRSFFDMPLAVNKQSLTFILERLDNERFEFVGCLTPKCKENFRGILRDFFSKRIDLDFATRRCCSEINPPVSYRQTKGWQLRALKAESSKIFTLGYGDYLLSIGETYCYVPHNNFEQSEDCLRLIAGKKHKIKDIQDNIYKNYNLRTAMYPTVPLHVDCQHIITKVPDRR
ncbi:MAG: hypothetical protein NWE92_05150 [Candidatus Bathyarchaeota archaeon]|nr:hypothetical protein [Candidatus Bathyarchaeota archaeon]